MLPAPVHVRLLPALKRAPTPATMPVLDEQGPRLVLGGARGEDNLAIPVKPDASTLFGPRGACLLHARGPLWISDTGHHRLLGWAQLPGAATLNVPTGICPLGGGLAVADAWNHRVLLWRRAPTAHNVPADIVLGQPDFACADSNRGAAAPTAQSLFWPYGVHWDGEHLWVADTGNRRVLRWRGLPRANGQPADLVLGQASFECRDENGGGEPGARSMRWPHALTTWGGTLCVTDAGNNRILIWNDLPTTHNAPASRVLGQGDFGRVDHNQSLYWPGAATLHMPYGIAASGPWFISADTANSRLIAWHRDDCGNGAPARALSGQSEFNAKGDNGWRTPTRRSLSWPYGISIQSGIGVIADSGNNRVLVWPLAAGLRR